ncbi:hypothetical protein EAF04_001250 [Stromatinia cepivora]|nr:hypothetical protein EAF04_001250 [Stromatinia cepivora]
MCTFTTLSYLCLFMTSLDANIITTPDQTRISYENVTAYISVSGVNWLHPTIMYAPIHRYPVTPV